MLQFSVGNVVFVIWFLQAKETDIFSYSEETQGDPHFGLVVPVCMVLYNTVNFNTSMA